MDRIHSFLSVYASSDFVTLPNGKVHRPLKDELRMYAFTRVPDRTSHANNKSAESA